jgi:hypothetical protein
MAFDENKDGKLRKAEVTDERLQPLFSRIDANGDGIATKEEMTAFFTKESASLGGNNRGGPNGPGGPGNRRGGGPGGSSEFGSPTQPGQIMPTFVQESLRLTETQKKQLTKLQQDVDVRLSKILNDDQKQRLSQMQERGPGVFGPGNGPGGQAGPGGFGDGQAGPGNGPPRPPRGFGGPDDPPQP